MVVEAHGPEWIQHFGDDIVWSAWEHAAVHKRTERGVAPPLEHYGVYGAGGPTVARSAGVPEHDGYNLVEKYWLRNWAVNAIAEEQIVKTCKGQKWLFNPVSKLWYSLRHEKDRFSTLNQGTGVFCFDSWVKHLRNGGPPLIGQMHDEVIGLVKLGMREKCIAFFKAAVHKVNEELKLNRDLDVDVQFGGSYADIH